MAVSLGCGLPMFRVQIPPVLGSSEGEDDPEGVGAVRRRPLPPACVAQRRLHPRVAAKAETLFRLNPKPSLAIGFQQHGPPLSIAKAPTCTRSTTCWRGGD